MLPDQSGYHVLRHLRDSGERLPVIMLTAKGEREDRILGLRLGADDYVTKPFSSEELMLRVQAVLRRAAPMVQVVPEEKVVAVQGLVIDPESRTARVDGQPVSLTRKEFDTLALMMRHPNHVFTRERLLEEDGGTILPVVRGQSISSFSACARRWDLMPNASRRFMARAIS